MEIKTDQGQEEFHSIQGKQIADENHFMQVLSFEFLLFSVSQDQFWRLL